MALIFFRKTTQFFEMLSVLLMGAALLLPPGLHLELCLGTDGHFEIRTSLCSDIPRKVTSAGCEDPLTERYTDHAAAFGRNHPGRCLDLTLGCGTSGELRSPDGSGSLRKTITRNASSALPGCLTAAGNATGLPAGQTGPPFPFPRLAFLRSVVLLI